jgi:hypothetical protein
MRPAPSIAAGQPADVDVYLVLDDFGERLGRSWHETDDERTDRDSVIRDLLKGLPTRTVIGVGARTLTELRRALEKAGVEFIPENGGGAGVRLVKRKRK